jgi:hypothetical protein
MTVPTEMQRILAVSLQVSPATAINSITNRSDFDHRCAEVVIFPDITFYSGVPVAKLGGTLNESVTLSVHGVARRHSLAQGAHHGCDGRAFMECGPPSSNGRRGSSLGEALCLPGIRQPLGSCRRSFPGPRKRSALSTLAF